MKLSGDFIIRNIADEYVIVPVGETAAKFHSLITANELGAFTVVGKPFLCYVKQKFLKSGIIR